MALPSPVQRLRDSLWGQDTGYYMPEGEFVGFGPEDFGTYYFPHASLSLGIGDVSLFESSPLISTLAEPTGYYQDVQIVETPSVPAEIDRRDQPSEPEDVQPMSWFDYWENQATGLGYPPAGTPGALLQPGFLNDPTNTPIASTPQQFPEDNDVGFLSDISDNTIYQGVDAALGGILPGGVPLGGAGLGGVPGVVTWAQAPTAPPPPNVVPFPTQPGVAPVACGTDDPMKGMVYKKVCGSYKWVKQKRRRRKKLVSQSDAQGLSTLIAILGNGKATQAWIATHCS